MIGIVIPIKRLHLAKSRLIDLLDPADRQQLVVTMVRHVITTARQAVSYLSIPARIWLVSPEPTLATESEGVEWLPDHQEELNAALTEARRRIQAAGVQMMMVLAGDLPFVTVRDLILLSEALTASDVVVAPDQHGQGTNALGLHLPSHLPFGFGPDSADYHLRTAARLGLRASLISTPTLAFDLDDGERLQQYYRCIASCDNLAR